MGQSFLQLENGLLIPQQGAEWAAVNAALKQHDPHLSCGKIGDCWKVYYQASEDLPPEFLTDWRDPDGTPRELSMGLVDQVRGQDRNSRAKRPNADELNVKREEELAKHKQAMKEGIIENTTFKHGKPVLPRSVSLRRARSKTGYHDFKR